MNAGRRPSTCTATTVPVRRWEVVNSPLWCCVWVDGPHRSGADGRLRVAVAGVRVLHDRPGNPRRREPGDPGTREAVAHPRPLRQTRALLAVPRVVLRHRIRHWISHADRTLVMSCRARTRHTYDGTRRDGRMT